MFSYRLPRLRRARRLFAFGLLFASVLLIAPVNARLASINASASAPDTLCDPYGMHCHGEVQWPGATYGVRTLILVNSLSVPTVGSDFLTEELWLDDWNTGAWTEIGYYSGYPYSVGALNYFYAYKPPNGTYTIQNIAQVPLPDVGGYSDIKITRNRQTPSTLLLAVVSTYQYTNWSAVITNNQGGTDWGGNNMSIGSEMGFTTKGAPSSNGTVKWTENRWQMYNGGNGQYVYQGSNGNIIAEPYQHPYWEIDPAHSSTGGIFDDWCCSYP